MRPFSAVLFLVLLSVMAGCFDRATDEHPSSSYPQLQESEVRGLSLEQIEGLRNGDGMGYALPAELNGYPGPKHVLELADELELNGSQRQATAEIRAQMLERAKATGVELVSAYESLDQEFRSQGIDAERLRNHTERIGSLEGALRSIHMEAHLAMMTVLTHAQILEYADLRGYGSGGHSEHAH